MVGEIVRQAAAGQRGDDQQRIAVEGLGWVETLLRKNHDYGGSAWKTPALAPECDPGTAIRVRMSDKIARLEQLLSGKAPHVSEETLDDTIRDLGAYCLLYLARPE